MWAALREWASPVSKALAAPTGSCRPGRWERSTPRVFFSHPLIQFSAAKVGTVSPFKNPGLRNRGQLGFNCNFFPVLGERGGRKGGGHLKGEWGPDSLAGSRGSIAWAELAVLRCAPLSIPIVPWLALFTASTLCVVLAALEEQRAD